MRPCARGRVQETLRVVGSGALHFTRTESARSDWTAWQDSRVRSLPVFSRTGGTGPLEAAGRDWNRQLLTGEFDMPSVQQGLSRTRRVPDNAPPTCARPAMTNAMARRPQRHHPLPDDQGARAGEKLSGARRTTTYAESSGAHRDMVLAFLRDGFPGTDTGLDATEHFLASLIPRSRTRPGAK